MTATVDTLSIAQNLQRAKFDRDQAEAVATEMAKLASAPAEHLATKTDLYKLRADAYKIALGIVIANAGVTFGLLKLLTP